MGDDFALGLGGAGLSVLAASASGDAVELAALLFLIGMAWWREGR